MPGIIHPSSVKASKAIGYSSGLCYRHSRLQLIVLYVPFMQTSFETAPINLTQMIVAFILGGVILFAVEIEKYLNRTVFAEEKAKPVTA